MKPNTILMSLLTFSVVVTGMGIFYLDTATQYSAPTAKIAEFSEKFNKYDTIDTKLKLIQASIQNINALNPLTWGNVAIFVVNIFAIMFDIPGVFHLIITEMINMTGFLPTWVAFYIESAILLIMIFSAIDAVRNS